MSTSNAPPNRRSSGHATAARSVPIASALDMTNERPAHLQDAMKIGSAISWLILTSLVVAVVVMSSWWNAASIPVTGSTTFILMFATMGLWMSLFLFALTLWRLIFPGRKIFEKSDGA